MPIWEFVHILQNVYFWDKKKSKKATTSGNKADMIQ